MSAHLTNEQIRLRLISSCVSDIDESAEFRKLLTQLCPNTYYLEHTGVTPILVDALRHLDEIRPPDPIQFVAAFILLNKGLYDDNPLFEHSPDDQSDLIDVSEKVASFQLEN